MGPSGQKNIGTSTLQEQAVGLFRTVTHLPPIVLTTTFIIVLFVAHSFHFSNLIQQTAVHNARQLAHPQARGMWQITTTARDNQLTPANASELTNVIPEWTRSLPELFIFRRTKKTGSSSMMAAFLDTLPSFGYVPLNRGEADVEIPLRHELVRTRGRRLMLVRHNHITRDVHPTRSAVIADTIRDGFERMTSFCRYIQHFESCDLSVIAECWRSNYTTAEIKYRWAGRQSEDSDTYIDLPLSAAHPGLSTSVMRSVFPGILLHIQRYNVKDSNCAETPELRALYQELFPHLDAEDNNLRKRMLIISGYPVDTHTQVGRKMNMTEMLDAAELLEQEKYGMNGKMKTVKAMSRQALQMRSGDLKWALDEHGKFVPVMRKDMNNRR